MIDVKGGRTVRKMVWTSLSLLLATTTIGLARPNRVALPEYRTGFTHYVHDRERANPKQIAEIWANDVALESARDGAPLDYGAVLVMEVWKAKMKSEDEPQRDADGNPIKDSLAAIVVMEKEPGWGADYPEDKRAGEWEFAAYGPDGSFKDIDYAGKCSYCHAPLHEQDYVQSWDALVEAARSR